MLEPLALFGGTFDPIHNGHLRAALEVCEELKLNQVVFMPCAQAPHAKDVEVDARHRLEMVRLATADNPRFAVSDMEVKQGGISYTSQTLATLNELNPGRRIYFLIGADAFFNLHSWNSTQQLFRLADFIVMARPGTPDRDLTEYLSNNLDPRFTPQQDGWARLPGSGGARKVTTTRLDISSTEIRRRSALGLSLAYLVPSSVEDYILRMNLYSSHEEDL